MKLRFILPLLLALLPALAPPAFSDTQTDRIAGISGHLAAKAPVVASTTVNITLSGTQTIDGIAVVANDRVLVKNQTDGIENGVYNVSATAWARAKDFNGARDVISGTLVWDPNRSSFYELSTADPITIGTTALSFSQQLPFSSFPTDIVFATDLGATTAGTAVANTAAIQTGIDGFGDLVGGTIYIERGILFNLQGLVWNNNATLKYSANSEADSPSTDGQATYEQVTLMNRANAAGSVNEVQIAAPVHPAIVIDAREDTTKRGAGSQSGLASVVFRKENVNQYQIGRHSDGQFSIAEWELRYTLDLGTNDWTINPIAGDAVVGDTSAATGTVVSITTTSMIVSWISGVFIEGETITAGGNVSNNPTVSISKTPTTRFNRFVVAKNGAGQGVNIPTANIAFNLTIGGSTAIEDAAGGVFGAAKAGLRMFDDLASPTIGVRWALNTTDDTMEWFDDQGVVLATLSMATGIFTPKGVETSTTAALDAVGNAINTSGKYEGRELWNATTDNPVYAVGSAAADIWVDGAGTTVHSPS